MAYESNLENRTYEAGGDISASQYRFVKAGATAGQVVACDTAGERTIGVLQNDPDAADKAATVGVGGISKVEAGAAVAADASVSVDAQGRAVTSVTAGHVIVGYARTAAAAAGELIAVELTRTYSGVI